MLRISGMRFDDARLTTAALYIRVNVLIMYQVVLSCFDLLLLCTSHTHIRRDCWRAIRCESTINREERAYVFTR